MDYERELQARLDELQQAFKGWSPRGGELSFTSYKRYIESDRTILLRAGGYADQPVWWWDDVTMLDIIGEKHWLPTELKRVKKQMETNAKNAKRNL